PPRRATVAAGVRRGDIALGAPSRELLADHPQRQELVALEAQDRAQSLVVVLGVEPVAALGAPRRQQLLVLQVPDLGDRDVGELLLQRLADRPDRDRLLPRTRSVLDRRDCGRGRGRGWGDLAG